LPSCLPAGGKLVYQLAKKKTTHPTCPISGQRLNGLPAVRPSTLHRVNKSKKTVHRAYGGHLAAGVVKDRIVRAFLVEEQKIVKKVRGSRGVGCGMVGWCIAVVIVVMRVFGVGRVGGWGCREAPAFLQ